MVERVYVSCPLHVVSCLKYRYRRAASGLYYHRDFLAQTNSLNYQHCRKDLITPILLTPTDNYQQTTNQS